MLLATLIIISFTADFWKSAELIEVIGAKTDSHWRTHCQRVENLFPIRSSNSLIRGLFNVVIIIIYIQQQVGVANLDLITDKDSF